MTGRRRLGLGALVLGALLLSSCASDADGVRSAGNVRVIELPDGPTGILPTRGVTSHPVGPPDGWRSGTVELDPEAVRAADFEGGPDVGVGLTTEPPEPHSPEGENLQGLVEVPLDWWNQAMEHPGSEVVLAEHDVSFAPGLDAVVTFRGAVTTGFVYHVQLGGHGYGFQPCIACDSGRMGGGSVIETDAGVIGLYVLPPGTRDVHTDQEFWLLEDTTMRGTLLITRFDAVGDETSVSYVDSTGRPVREDVTAIVDV
jgi:hypothetical protein